MKTSDDILLAVFRNPDKSIMTHIFAHPEIGFEGFGILMVDIIRQAAEAYNVDVDDIWEWIEKERFHYTTDIVRPS